MSDANSRSSSQGILPQLLIGVAITLVGAAIIGAFIIAGGQRWVEQTYYNVTHPLPARQDEATFVVLVSDFENDDAGRAMTLQLAEALAVEGGDTFKVIRYPRSLGIPTGNDVRADRDAIERLGRRWLERVDADLLIYGDVSPLSRAITIRTLPRSSRGNAGAEQLSIDEPATLSRFRGQIAAAVAGMIVTDIGPYGSFGRFEPEALRHSVSRLRPLAADDTLARATFGGIQHALAEATLVLSTQVPDQTEGAALRAESVSLFAAALTHRPRETQPAMWSATQAGLGIALQRQAEGNEAGATLDQALAAYQRSLASTQPDGSTGRLWARAQLLIGQLHLAMYERTGDSAALERALAASDEALRVLTPDVDADAAASLQHNRGVILQRWGDREDSQDRLQQAVEALNQSMQMRPYNDAPAYWLQTKEVLANTYALLAELAQDPRQSAHYRTESISALEDVASRYPRSERPFDWARAHHNLGSAHLQATQSEQELTQRARHAERAIAAFQVALAERALGKDTNPRPWANTLLALGDAYRVQSGLLDGERAAAAFANARTRLCEGVTTLSPDHPAIRDRWADMHYTLAELMRDRNAETPSAALRGKGSFHAAQALTTYVSLNNQPSADETRTMLRAFESAGADPVQSACGA